MAVEVRTFQCTLPAGTLSSAPTKVDMDMPAREVVQINVRVPPGPNGNVGFAIGSKGLPIIPDNTGAWIITNDEALKFPLTGQMDSGAWQLIGYNTGTYAHTIYVTFLLDLVDGTASTISAASPDLSGQEVIANG